MLKNIYTIREVDKLRAILLVESYFNFVENILIILSIIKTL